MLKTVFLTQFLLNAPKIYCLVVDNFPGGIMKIKNILLGAALLLTVSVTKAYDSTWYDSQGWSGEYPPGFQVYKKGITVLGRTSADDTEAPSVSCVLKRNRYAPGRSLPKADYVQKSKIVDMFAKADVEYPTYNYNPATESFDDVFISIKAGDKIEFLVYGAEGWFLARHNGVEFEADQSLFDHVTYPETADGGFPYEMDQWIYLSCVNNVSVWLMLSDLQTSEADDLWIDGVRSYFHNPY